MLKNGVMSDITYDDVTFLLLQRQRASRRRTVRIRNWNVFKQGRRQI